MHSHSRIDAASNWRSQFQHSPTVFLAAALGSGLLLGIATNYRRSRLPPQPMPDSEPPPKRRNLGWDWSDSVGVIKSVLIGIAITQAKKALIKHGTEQRTAPPNGAAPESRGSND